MSGPKNIAFMRLPETEKMGLQHPDHQFKSGCRLSNPLIIQGIFLFVCMQMYVAIFLIPNRKTQNL